MRSASYYKGKARLAGILGIPFAILVMASGYVGYQYATSNITPATVSVSGYTRADATHVSAYNRRPRGSVVHDEPYEGLSLVSLIVFLGGAYFACRPIFRFIVMSPLSLLPLLDPTILPPQPIEHAVPVRRPLRERTGYVKTAALESRRERPICTTRGGEHMGVDTASALCAPPNETI